MGQPRGREGRERPQVPEPGRQGCSGPTGTALGHPRQSPHLCGRYDPDHVCNASDNTGRYSYSKQPEVCKWNLQKLAEALEPELPHELGKAILAEEFDTTFRRHYLQKMRRKLGLVWAEREEDGALVAKLLETMHLTGEWAQCTCHPGLSIPAEVKCDKTCPFNYFSLYL